MRYTADFETITDPNDCRVWAYGICSIDTLSFEYGNNIHDFMDWCKQENNPTLYFHNLKFDGSFILSYLLENSYKWVKDKKEATNRTFTTLIDTSGKFYQIEVYFKVYNKKYSKVTFLNSLNILPFSIAKIAQAFNLPLVKGEIDYDLFRPIGHELTIEEKLYLKNDCEIAARALSFLFNHDPPLTAMTQASNGLLHLKEVIGIDNFKRHFPILCDKTAQTDYDKYIVDTEIRRSYKGGYCDVKKDIVCKEINEPGIILDVNSLYPWVMATCDLPHGVPVPFKGKYTHSNDYPLFIQLFSCQFDLKLDKIPTIQLKNNGRFSENEYIESTKGEEVVLCLTCVDMELFFNHYDVYEINYIGGYMFRSAKGIFAPYVKHWTEQKTLAKINHNDGMYTLSKLMQNAVYGRMALNPRVASKKPFLNEDGILCYKQLESEYRDPLYIPAGSFITAWARYTTITAAQYNYGRWVYSDTDSVHLLGTSNPINMLLDSTKLGAWDHEFTFERAIYLRQKTYLLYGYEPDNPDKMKHKLACAGMPRCVRQKRDIQRQNDDGSYNIVDFDNFKFGSVFYGALKPKRVKGGIVLENIPWMLKD